MSIALISLEVGLYCGDGGVVFPLYILQATIQLSRHHLTKLPFLSTVSPTQLHTHFYRQNESALGFLFCLLSRLYALAGPGLLSHPVKVAMMRSSWLILFGCLSPTFVFNIYQYCCENIQPYIKAFRIKT